MHKIKVTITQLPIDTFSYFQWFLLGLYELNEQKKIQLKFKISLIDHIILLWFNNKFLAGTLRHLKHRFLKVPRYNLLGYVEYNGTKRTFAIDPKDSPFIFTTDHLEKCDCYFKNQCPIEINKEGFKITPDIIIPFFDVNFESNGNSNNMFGRIVSDKIYKFKNKIYPGMVGPRRLAWCCKYNAMKKRYSQYLSSQNICRTKKLVAYFGNAFGPTPSKKMNNFDLDWEADLMAYIKDKGNHPNEKRAIAIDIINSLDKYCYDGRLINDINNIHHKDKVVELSKFCDFIAEFSYNLNISGYRLSIPNRFIESFMAGTAIITDKLSVKWYLPFDSEVIETSEMGYKKNSAVDWDRFRNDIVNLPKISKNEIIKLFEQKWAPTSFAKYIINTTLKS